MIGIGGGEEIGRSSFMMGIMHENKKLVSADLIWKHFLKFFIYKNRAMKKIPKFPSLRYELEGMLELTSMRGISNHLLNINILYQNLL